MSPEPTAFNVGEFVGGIAAGAGAVMGLVIWLIRYVASLNRKMHRVEVALTKALGGKPSPYPGEEVTRDGRRGRRHHEDDD